MTLNSQNGILNVLLISKNCAKMLHFRKKCDLYQTQTQMDLGCQFPKFQIVFLDFVIFHEQIAKKTMKIGFFINFWPQIRSDVGKCKEIIRFTGYFAHDVSCWLY